MSGWRMPRSWRDYIATVDQALKDAEAPHDVRSGICEDIVDHLRQMCDFHPDLKPDDLPALLDPPQSYAAEFAEAMIRRQDEEANPSEPIRLRQCQSHHGEDDKRRIHICGNCLQVFHGCLEYETHVCSRDRGLVVKSTPYWSHKKRWAAAVVIAALLFLPLHGCVRNGFDAGKCDGSENHTDGNQVYLRNVQQSIVAFRAQQGRMPESLQEVFEHGLMSRGWVLPGDVANLGAVGGFPIGRLTYIYAGGAEAEMPGTRQPMLIYPQRLGKSRDVCFDVAYADGDTRHYPSLGAFLRDWEAGR